MKNNLYMGSFRGSAPALHNRSLKIVGKSPDFVKKLFLVFLPYCDIFLFGRKGGTMKLRLAEKKDLPELKVMFDNIVNNMRQNNIIIWNEFYPYEEFAENIINKNIYILMNDDEILAAFGIYDSMNGSDCFAWKNKKSKALYIGGIGVNVKHLRKGIGILALNNAIETAKQKNAKYLRLLVCDINKPAINLYTKYGFTKVDGLYTFFSEYLDKNICEFAFEIKL